MVDTPQSHSTEHIDAMGEVFIDLAHAREKMALIRVTLHEEGQHGAARVVNHADALLLSAEAEMAEIHDSIKGVL